MHPCRRTAAGVKGVTMEDVGLVKGLVLTGFFGMVGFFPLVAVLLVLWAPIAALLCANSAHQHGLEVRRYAVAGGVYSLLLLLPWIYLLMRMAGDQPPRILVKCAYVVLFAAWLWLPVMGGGTYIASGHGVLAHFAGPADVVRWIFFVIWLGTLIWMLYRAVERGSDKYHGGATAIVRNYGEKEEDPPIMPKMEYIAPFIIAMSTAVLTCAAIFAGLLTA